MQAVRIDGGHAGNVVPDACVVTVNFRFAPDRSVEQALDHVGQLFKGHPLTVLDASPGALPGLTQPAAAQFIEAVGEEPLAKYGWTDVSRFAALGIPALNFGPGDPNLAHTREEHVDVRQITRAADLLRGYLS
jgi:succinyl-diaminopimelate desuccinylase